MVGMSSRVASRICGEDIVVRDNQIHTKNWRIFERHHSAPVLTEFIVRLIFSSLLDASIIYPSLDACPLPFIGLFSTKPTRLC